MIFLPAIQTLTLLFLLQSVNPPRTNIQQKVCHIQQIKPHKQALIKHISCHGRNTHTQICTQILVIAFPQSIISISSDSFCPSPSFSFSLSLEPYASTDVRIHYFNWLPPMFLLFLLCSICVTIVLFSPPSCAVWVMVMFGFLCISDTQMIKTQQDLSQKANILSLVGLSVCLSLHTYTHCQ